MAKIELSLIQELRNRTGVGMMDCKKALEEANGDIEKAAEILRKKGAAVAAKRAENVTSQGIVASYIHAGSKVGVLVEVDCETDFVARTDAVKQFAQDLALHIAASKPLCVTSADLDPAYLEKERKFFTEQLASSGKPANMIEKIVEGKVQKLYSEACLMGQPFVKNDKVTIDDLLKDLIAKMGEKIVVRRFVRYEVGA